MTLLMLELHEILKMLFCCRYIEICMLVTQATLLFEALQRHAPFQLGFYMESAFRVASVAFPKQIKSDSHVPNSIP